MAKEKCGSACFKIYGDALTGIVRDLVLEGRWFHAFKIVREDLQGITWEQAMSVLNGTYNLTGDSSIGIGLEPSDPADKEIIRYKRDMMWLYSCMYMPPGGEYPFKPYALVTGYGEGDLAGPQIWRYEGIECYRPDSRNDGFHTLQERLGVRNWTGNDTYKRAMYYANNPMQDRAYVVKAPDPKIEGCTREFAVLFKPCYANTPFWIEPCGTPQEAVDVLRAVGGRLDMRGGAKFTAFEDLRDTLADLEPTDNVVGIRGDESDEELRESNDWINDQLKQLVPEGLEHVAENIVNKITGDVDWTSEPTTGEHADHTSGYILRTGEFYPCRYMEHAALAHRILINKLGVTEDIEDPQKEADRRGFVRLQQSAVEPVISVMCEKKPTKKQINAVFDHSQAHGPLENYDKFMDEGGVCRILLNHLTN